MMGVPTFYTRLLAEPSFTREAARQRAPVRLRLGAAAAGDVRRVRGAHRPAHPRALRDDRDRDEHVEPARRPATGRHRRPAAARRDRPHRRRRRRALRSRRDRRHRAQGPERLPGLLEPAGEDARGVHRRRLLPHRRHGHVDARGLRADRRPGEGHDHHRRPQRLPEGNRGADRRAARRRGIGGRRRAGRRFRRGRGRRHRRQGRARADRGVGDRRAQGRHRVVQGAEAGVLRRPSCRATRWARCRRRCCGSNSARSEAARPSPRGAPVA